MENLYEWFCNNRAEIIENHHGQYALILPCSVVKYFDDENSAVSYAFANNLKMGEFLIQCCNTEDEDTMFYYNQAVAFE